MRTATLALLLLLTSLAWLPPAAAVVDDDDPEPRNVGRQQLLLELSLPPVGLPPVGKVAPLTPDLEGTDLTAYTDRAHKDSTVRKVVRAAQVALWACSHETAPVPLQIEVAAVRKKNRIDP